jgi:hypothetical protein
MLLNINETNGLTGHTPQPTTQVQAYLHAKTADVHHRQVPSKREDPEEANNQAHKTAAISIQTFLNFQTIAPNPHRARKIICVHQKSGKSKF